jgi:hypothetical protein
MPEAVVTPHMATMASPHAVVQQVAETSAACSKASPC